MGVNDNLKKLYESKWKNLSEQAKYIKGTYLPTNPLLLQIDENKLNQPNILKVMIFGQEVLGYANNIDFNLDELLEYYYIKFAKKSIHEIRKRTRGSRKSAFWRGFEYFVDNIKNKNPDKNIVTVWNNISKIGKKEIITGKPKAGVTREIIALERNNFIVIEEEVKIINPDIVIFFTGRRDGDIKFNFKGVKFKELDMTSKKNLQRKYMHAAKVSHPSLPEKSFRIYHPSYFGGFNHIKNDILDELAFDN